MSKLWHNFVRVSLEVQMVCQNNFSGHLDWSMMMSLKPVKHKVRFFTSSPQKWMSRLLNKYHASNVKIYSLVNLSGIPILSGLPSLSGFSNEMKFHGGSCQASVQLWSTCLNFGCLPHDYDC